ncbi:hypothetical protein B296_00026967 [Ensete ventricosum]|uniref:Uncharacterized protein n=1 Tax=Ensete ventricosum TaxID=4639 RepID=A0A427A8H3_ENSVE|nr:hypothetical protein B296_00026967 [Ensete ventricosum]
MLSVRRWYNGFITNTSFLIEVRSWDIDLGHYSHLTTGNRNEGIQHGLQYCWSFPGNIHSLGNFSSMHKLLNGTDQFKILSSASMPFWNIRNVVNGGSGNLIGRAVIEFCHNGPPVKNFISLGGPHAGTASVPLCGVSAHLAPSGYLKIPTVSIAFFF